MGKKLLAYLQRLDHNNSSEWLNARIYVAEPLAHGMALNELAAVLAAGFTAVDAMSRFLHDT